MKELLFSVTIKDCDIQAFRGSGAGGQKRNKTSSGQRIVHRASGAVGQASDAREQHLNKRNAFLRMLNTDTFKKWHKVETARRCKQKMEEPIDVDKLVDEQMKPGNIKVEVKNNEGDWTLESGF